MLVAVVDDFFRHFGPCAEKRGDICSGAGEWAQEADFGLSESNDLFDLRNARHVILWARTLRFPARILLHCCAMRAAMAPSSCSSIRSTRGLPIIATCSGNASGR
jgi:hypothetical protein